MAAYSLPVDASFATSQPASTHSSGIGSMSGRFWFVSQTLAIMTALSFLSSGAQSLPKASSTSLFLRYFFIFRLGILGLSFRWFAVFYSSFFRLSAVACDFYFNPGCLIGCFNRRVITFNHHRPYFLHLVEKMRISILLALFKSGDPGCINQFHLATPQYSLEPPRAPLNQKGRIQ